MSEFALEDHHVLLLTLAAEALDRAHEARLALKEHGTVEEKKLQPQCVERLH